MTTHTQPKPAGTPTWVDLTTPEHDAARDFYRAVFGWAYDVVAPSMAATPTPGQAGCKT